MLSTQAIQYTQSIYYTLYTDNILYTTCIHYTLYNTIVIPVIVLLLEPELAHLGLEVT